MNPYRLNLSPCIKAANAAAAGLQRLGLLEGGLEEEALLEEARRHTGLCDFGDNSFRKPFKVLLEVYATEARLTWVGRLAAKHDVLRLLTNRLRLIEDRKRYPAIARETIRSPLFIVGLPRTGSTLLHNLLAQDPANRAPLTWEVMFPSPPPARVGSQNDPRIAQTDKLLQQFDWLLPEFKSLHPMKAQWPIECVAIMSHTFLSAQFQSTFHIPTYQQWLYSGDFYPVYLFHRRFLQHLQWRSPAPRWVLKAPAHLFALESLLDVYPDARIIQTHRDPLKVIGSVASLDTVLRGVFSDEIDPQAIGMEAVEQWADAARHTIKAREQVGSGQDRFWDVYYRDLIQDPIGTVERLYANFDLPFTDQVKGRMTRFLAENPKDKYGAHRYSLAQFGLTADFVARAFQDYIRRFRLEPEPL